MMDLFRGKSINVMKARLLTDGSGKSKGAGFVEFASPDDAQRAIKECNGMEFNGRRMVAQLPNK